VFGLAAASAGDRFLLGLPRCRRFLSLPPRARSRAWSMTRTGSRRACPGSA